MKDYRVRAVKIANALQRLDDLIMQLDEIQDMNRGNSNGIFTDKDISDLSMVILDKIEAQEKVLEALMEGK